MAFTLDNFVRSTLQADITAGATTVTVTKAAPPLRDPPAATVDAPGLLILQDVPTSPTKIEVISYTGRSIAGTVVTLTGVTRSLEGTTPYPWPAGTPTFQGITAGALEDLQEQVSAQSAVTALDIVAGEVTVSGAIGSWFTLDLTANAAITLADAPAAGTAYVAVLKITQDTSAHTLTWPAGVTWSGGAYTVSTGAGAVDTVGLMTMDGGSTWLGVYRKAFS